MADAKYLINVDFFEISRIHLNPEKYDIDARCQTGLKNHEAGGTVLATEEEAFSYLRNEKILTLNNKPVKNLQRCKLCSSKQDYTL
ncbi:MAG: hypothetical protein K8Q89_11000 [Nitrosarchaeum sp.]|nr:hypothetical protein [Nitrosarchaeum sp.]